MKLTSKASTLVLTRHKTLSAKSAAALDQELMSTGAFSIDQLMELAGLSVSQAGTTSLFDVLVAYRIDTNWCVDSYSLQAPTCAQGQTYLGSLRPRKQRR
jgi:hypothetical protein